MDNALNADEFRQRQSKFHKKIAAQEKDILSRSIFVTNVRDLRVESNLEALKKFFNDVYGDVKYCRRTVRSDRRKGRGRPIIYPPARVVFFHKDDAERVFGGQELSKVVGSQQIRCPLGHKNGEILVRPSIPSNDILLEETEGSQVRMRASGLWLGHWCPGEREMDMLSNDHQDEGEWLGVVEGSPPVMVIDIKERCIELTYKGPAREYRIMFKFKELLTPIALCRQESDELYLIFSLKNPPLVHAKLSEYEPGDNIAEILWQLSEINLVNENEPEFRRTRTWDRLSGEQLGLYLGYKLLIPGVQIKELFLNDQLRESGVIGFSSEDFQNPTRIKSTDIGFRYDEQFNAALKAVRNFQIGKNFFVMRRYSFRRPELMVEELTLVQLRFCVSFVTRESSQRIMRLPTRRRLAMNVRPIFWKYCRRHKTAFSSSTPYL